MRTHLLAILGFAAILTQAQTLKIHSSQVSVAIPAAEAGTMTVGPTGTFTVMGRTYDIADIDSITVDNSEYQASTVSVNYNGNTARLLVAGNIAPQLAINTTNANVSITADAGLQEEVTYVLTGSSSNGSFYMDGEYKATLELRNLTLNSNGGAAIDIANGKRINVIVPENTTTTLADAQGGTHKACFFVNGHPEFSGSGHLVLSGNTKHAFASDEYTYLKSGFGTIEVKHAVTDGLHIDQYFQMDGGTVIINGTQKDGIEVSQTKDPTDELNGQVFINGGSLELAVSAEDTKGIKSEKNMTISGGSITASVSGDGAKGISAGGDLLINKASGNAPAIAMKVTGTTYMPNDPVLESKCRGIKVKGNFTFDGGNIDISATGQKSKAISVDGNYYYVSGSLNCAVDASNT